MRATPTLPGSGANEERTITPHAAATSRIALTDAERLARLCEMATEAGVTCLDAVWRGFKVKHRFRCAQGHTWERLPGNVAKSARCPYCHPRGWYGPRLADGLERLQQAATRHGGLCLAERFTSVHHRYRFQCAQGHTFEATGHNILNDRWCGRCKGARVRKSKQWADGLARLKAVARAHGGRCLSSAYVNVKTLYRFECAQGHRWEDIGEGILKGQWCRPCGYTRFRYTLEDAQKLARDRGGRCLSKRYLNWHTRLHWLCHRGHSWHAPFGSIRQGHWCRVCAYQDQVSGARSRSRRHYQAAGDSSTPVSRGKFNSTKV